MRNSNGPSIPTLDSGRGARVLTRVDFITDGQIEAREDQPDREQHAEDRAYAVPRRFCWKLAKRGRGRRRRGRNDRRFWWKQIERVAGLGGVERLGGPAAKRKKFSALVLHGDGDAGQGARSESM